MVDSTKRCLAIGTSTTFDLGPELLFKLLRAEGNATPFMIKPKAACK